MCWIFDFRLHDYVYLHLIRSSCQEKINVQGVEQHIVVPHVQNALYVGDFNFDFNVLYSVNALYIFQGELFIIIPFP